MCQLPKTLSQNHDITCITVNVKKSTHIFNRNYEGTGNKILLGNPNVELEKLLLVIILTGIITILVVFLSFQG